MKRSRQILFGILLLILLFLAGILLRSVIQEAIVKPVALLLWVGRRLLASIDQVVYWTGLILIGLFLAIVRMIAPPTDMGATGNSGGHNLLKDMHQWRNLILMTRNETAHPNLLTQNLATLLKNVYASRQPNLIPWQVYDALDQGDIPLPDSIRAFLSINPVENHQISLLQRLQRIRMAPGRWVRHWTRQDVSDYYASITEVISFLEQQLESEDDE